MKPKEQEKNCSIKEWISVLAVVLGLWLSAWTWYITEQNKLLADEYKRKEERYIHLLDALRGFYTGSEDKQKNIEFLKQVDLCWLYCPDDVIRKAYGFIELMKPEVKASYNNNNELQRKQKEAVGELVLAIRKDLLEKTPVEKTTLKQEDFQMLNPS